MKVLVTGVTGFIGTALSRDLSEAGHTVTGLSRDPAAAHQRAPWLDQVFGWDAMAETVSTEALSGMDAVIHLAGERIAIPLTTAKKRAVLESRRAGTRHLVQGLSLATPRPRVLISASAVGYYGDHGDAEVMEETPPASHFLAQVCLAWEHEAAQARGPGLRVAVLRIGHVLGPGDGGLAPLFRLAKLGLGGPLGSGRQWWPWIHLADVIGLTRHILEGDVDGMFNATAPQPVRQREFARILGRVLHRPAFLPAPAFVLKLVLGEMASEVLLSRRAIPHRAQQVGYQFRFPELEPALRDILLSKAR